MQPSGEKMYFLSLLFSSSSKSKIYFQLSFQGTCNISQESRHRMSSESPIIYFSRIDATSTVIYFTFFLQVREVRYYVNFDSKDTVMILWSLSTYNKMFFHGWTWKYVLEMFNFIINLYMADQFFTHFKQQAH